MSVKLKRIYDPAEQSDGQRVLVDRLWPRGISKERAALSLWLKEVAPSTQLRQWFGHKVELWPEFERRYRLELKNNPAWQTLVELADQGSITLLYAAQDQQHNEAQVLKRLLDERNA